MAPPINVCHNVRSEPRIHLEVCRRLVAEGHALCLKRIHNKSTVLKCAVAREIKEKENASPVV